MILSSIILYWELSPKTSVFFPNILILLFDREGVWEKSYGKVRVDEGVTTVRERKKLWKRVSRRRWVPPERSREDKIGLSIRRSSEFEVLVGGTGKQRVREET